MHMRAWGRQSIRYGSSRRRQGVKYQLSTVWYLQVEAFDEVERAFVHVDYCQRLEPEHKVDFNLRHQNSDLFDSQEIMRSAASQSGHLSGKLSGSLSGGESSGLSQKGGSPSTHSDHLKNNGGSRLNGASLV